RLGTRMHKILTGTYTRISTCGRRCAMLVDADVVRRVHWSEPLAASHLAVTLASLPIRPFVDIVCVGTDRSTGDSLGPFIGSVLLRQKDKGFIPPSVSVYGTIHEPVHALNLA